VKAEQVLNPPGAGAPTSRIPLVQIEQVTKIFHTPAGDFPALRGVSADFYAGEFISVVGKSGSGKSTLANMITGIDHPSSGTVRVGGVELHRMSESDMSVWRGRNLGIVFQFFQLLPMLTLLENVMLPMDFAGVVPAGEREERAFMLLRMVGLENDADHLPGAVAGGQQQTAAIARALANDPPLLIADEPTGNLDSRTAETVFDIFTGLVAAGKTIIMVTHDPALAARTTRILHIADGLLVDPPPLAVAERPEADRQGLLRQGLLRHIAPLFSAWKKPR
jgi:putative ABC transport system ATP-binding protein